VANITVVGLGPGDLGQMSLETYELLRSGKKIYLRTEIHPCVQELKVRGITFESFDSVYEAENTFDDVYSRIVEELFKATLGGEDIIYAVPGHPRTAEKTVEILVREADIRNVAIDIRNSMSFMDPLFNCLGIDPNNGVGVIDGGVSIVNPNYRVWNIVSQVYDQFTASERKLDLMNYYPDEFLIYVVSAAGICGKERIQKVPIFELDRLEWIDHLTCLAIPPLPQESYPPDWDKLLSIMDQLRGESGCPWDREQTHLSLRPYLIEETYEVLEALDEMDMYKFCEELGDLLLQVVFHAQLAKENSEFTIQDVVKAIVEKLIRRHPHVFAGTSAEDSKQVLVNWEKIKETESGLPESIFDGIAKSLTALMYAKKVQAKAAKVGFDWDTIDGPIQKVHEELEELLAAENHTHREEELGDLLFAVVNLGRFIAVDPEVALRQTVKKFISRFHLIELTAKKQGRQLEDLSIEEMDTIWENAKKQ
jgi:tetrapyrrole methylase family protein / MazG family protein